jgi:hypothetical protein
LSVLNLLHDIVTFEDFTEDDVTAIKPAISHSNQFASYMTGKDSIEPCDDRCDKELGSVGVLSSVGHAYTD